MCQQREGYLLVFGLDMGRSVLEAGLRTISDTQPVAGAPECRYHREILLTAAHWTTETAVCVCQYSNLEVKEPPYITWHPSPCNLAASRRSPSRKVAGGRKNPQCLLDDRSQIR